MVYVARSKDAKQKLQGVQPRPVRTVELACGHTTDQQPALSRPDRWWCCGQWRRAR